MLSSLDIKSFWRVLFGYPFRKGDRVRLKSKGFGIGEYFVGCEGTIEGKGKTRDYRPSFETWLVKFKAKENSLKKFHASTWEFFVPEEQLELIGVGKKKRGVSQ